MSVGPVLQGTGLWYAYGSGWVLSGIDIEVKKGELLGIIGPNGSGKSTLLKNLSGLLKPQKGRVLLEGKDLSSYRPREVARKVAVVGQENPFDFAFTVEELVLMGRTPFLRRFQSEGLSDIAAARAAMEATDILELAEREVTSLSGGEKQRVVIARALAQDPEVLLLDEPTSFLDINHQVEIFELVRRLVDNRGLAAAAVLHDLNLAAQYCDRLIMMDEGKKVTEGAPVEVLTAQNLRDVYGVEVIVGEHLMAGTPFVMPVSSRRGGIGSPSGRRRVHVICGGGSGAGLLRRLSDRGYIVSAGVVNVGDSDWQLAKALGLQYVEEDPFSPVSERNHRRNLEMIANCDAVVVAEIPFGEGNLKNLEAAMWAADNRIPVILVGQLPAAQRDFTGGRGAAMLENLMRRRARVSPDPEGVLEILSDLKCEDKEDGRNGR